MDACNVGTNSCGVADFEGLADGERVNGWTDGGFGQLGSGPGPDLGVSIPGALAFIDPDDSGTGDFGGEPSPSTAIRLDGVAVAINSPAGFSSGLSMFYSQPSVAGMTVRVYDDVNATGHILATAVFGQTPVAGAGDPTYPSFHPAGLTFPGVARSVYMSGGHLDNMRFGGCVPP